MNTEPQNTAAYVPDLEEETEVEQYVPVRLDVFVQSQYPNLSRSSVQKLIKSGLVTVDDVIEKRPSYTVKERNVVVLTAESTQQNQEAHAKLELPVIYEDDQCVVINKPLGILTHSKGAFNPEETVATWLADRPDFSFEGVDEDENNQRAGIVHRLDRATSGVMICAKNQYALRHLQKQFQDRKAKKTYIARIEGRLRQPEAIIDIPVERNPKQPQRFRAGHNGKTAQTAYMVLKELPHKGNADVVDTLVELKPTTGRTHQLRVHLAYLGHPIIGDVFYDGRTAKRLFLHATELEITLPGSERKTFHAPLPDNFNEQTVS